MILTRSWSAVRRVLYSCNCLATDRDGLPLTPVIEAQVETPPWPPQAILDDRVAYMSQIRTGSPRAIKGTDQDCPLSCLYRLYERLVLDDTIGYRNEIEYFWHHKGWLVAEIPDPQDPDPSRYAFMAAIPSLLVWAFNSNIEIGLARYTPPIISSEEADVLRNMPNATKVYRLGLRM